MTGAVALPLAAAATMALVHLFADRLRFLDGVPRSRWLSVAGGISVAYVVVHLLPELAEFQEATASSGVRALDLMERHVYVFALLGLAVFYGVELKSRAARRGGTGGEVTPAATAFSIAAYAVYNGVIGSPLVDREGGVILFAVAMALHFVVNDRALREDHGEAYHSYGRWLLAAAVVAGAVVGLLLEVPELVVGLLVAFIGGGIILNVLK